MQIPEDKQKMLDGWQQSGLTKIEYCRQNKIGYHFFNYWQKRANQLEMRQPSKAGMFREIVVKHPACYPVEITYPSGIKVTVGEASADFIRQLIGNA